MSTFTGKTVDDAIQAGLQKLQIARAAAKVRVIQTGRKGFLGIGRRKAKVEITKKEQPQPKASSLASQPARAHANSVRSSQVRHTHSEASSSSQASFTIKQRQPARSHSDNDRYQRNNHHAPVSRNQRNHEAVKQLENYLGHVIRLLGITATMKAEFKTRKQVKIDFRTNKEGLLIGKHGLTINALQALSRIYLNRLGIYHLYIELDTANYRQRRMEILGRLAEKTAREAVATGKPVYLDPMPSFERKKIHKTLEDSAHVMTYSAGREPYRAVVVAPK